MRIFQKRAVTLPILNSILVLLLAHGSWAADGKFLPLWNDVCGIGEALENGCENIHSRQIIDNSQKPWSAIGRVNYAGYNTQQHCTGTLISERHFLTAAHCLFNHKRSKWIEPKQIHFVAGYQRGEAMEHSIATNYTVSKEHNTATNKFRFTPSADWAVVELKDNIGAKTGYVPINTNIGPEQKLLVAGYPSLRPHVLSADESCKKVIAIQQSRVFLHDCEFVDVFNWCSK